MIQEQRIYQAYYTKSEPIVSYMIDLLKLKGDEYILEPCAGDGVFIDPIIFKYSNIQIDAFELNDETFKNLLIKYSSNENITVRQADTLTDIDLEFQCSMGGKYDAVIANPPYGAWRTTEERKQLKKRYNGFYAKESYALFLYRCIESLKTGGKLVFIIPDTYLNLHRHKDIRKYILSHTKIKQIALFPSSYFPDVNFGYANLSIIALEKSQSIKDSRNNSFQMVKGFKSVEELGKSVNHLSYITLKQEKLLNTNDYAFLSNCNPKISRCIEQSQTNIGDICNCVTGFYSGNDKKYLKALNKEIRNAKRYDVVDVNKVTFDTNVNSVNGIDSHKHFVPIVKGGNTKYYKPDNWFMEWSTQLVDFFKKDKKSRYQNASYYFKKGIAVPMVSSSSITGAIIENRLFDQSIVGVFPKDENNLHYLLAFFQFTHLQQTYSHH